MLGKFCRGSLLRTSRVLSTPTINLELPSRFNKSPLSSYLIESPDKQWRRGKKDYHTTTTRFQDNRRNYKGEGSQYRKSGQSNVWILGFLGTAFIAKDLITRTRHAEQAKKTTLEIEPILITKDNFEETLEKLRVNDPGIISIQFTFSLNKSELQKLNSAIQSNTKLSCVTWHEDQDINDLSIKSIGIRLASNNRNQRSYPTDLVHGLLSAHCASETGKEAGKSKVKAGDTVTFGVDNTLHKVFQTTVSLNLNVYLCDWRVYEVIEDAQTGYLGIIYENKKGKQIVLAHRSTNFALGLTTGNILKQSGVQTDLESVVMGRIVTHQAYGYVATYKAIELAKTSKNTLSITGHSLGAWLAQLSVYYCDRDLNFKNVKAVTFDGPGVFEMMKQMSASEIRGAGTFDRNELDIVSYFSAPNIVNCTNKHPGIAFTLPLKVGKVSVPERFTQLMMGEKNEDALAATWGHSIEYILIHFNTTTGSPEPDRHRQVVKWPSITHQEYGHREQALLEKHAQEVLGEGLLSRIGTKFGVTITSKVFGSETTTLGSLYYFLRDFKNGKLNQDQFWKAHEFLDREQGYKPVTQDKLKDFELLYRGQYKTVSVNEHEREVTDRIDGYLRNVKLYEASILKASEGTLREGLASLVKLYEYKRASKSIAIKEEHKAVTISLLRDKMRILLSECQIELDKCINSANPSLVEKEVQLLDHIPVKFEHIKFIGRKDDFAEINEQFKKQKVVIISGEGGVGKSSLTGKYVADYIKGQNGLVRWVSAKDGKITEQYKNLATDLGVYTEKFSPEQIRDAVYAKLSSLGKEILLVIDNMENRDEAQFFLQNLPANVKLLITTRDSGLLREQGYRPIRLERFNESEKFEYLKSHLTETHNEHDIRKLAQKVSNLAFDLDSVIASFQKNPTMGIEEYLEDLKKFKVSKYPATAKIINELGEGAKEILSYCAYLDADTISAELLKKIMPSREKLNKSMIELTETTSLLKRQPDGVFSLHENLQELIQNQQQKKTTVTTLVQAMDLDFDLSQVKKEALIEAGKKGAEKYFEENPKQAKRLESSDIARSLDNVGTAYQALGGEENIRQGLHYQVEALNIRKTLFPGNNPSVAASLNNIGMAYQALGGEENIRQGLYYQMEALNMTKALFPGNHSSVANLLNNVGMAYQALGGEENIRQGLYYQVEALNIRKTLFPGNNPSVAASLNNIGMAYQALGGEENIRQGLYYQMEALNMTKALFPGNHSSVANLLNNVGMAYQALGGEENIRQGLYYQMEALNMRKTLLSKK